MPFFKTAGKLVYYAHVPKCAGSAMENYISARFENIAMLNRRHYLAPEDQRWSRSSPQHITAQDLNLLIPSSMFDHSFSIVRHPVARMVSMYHFNVEVSKQLDSSLSFSDWLSQMENMSTQDPYYLDNHPRPMVDFIPASTRVFKLENGTDPLIAYLDEISGSKVGPRELPMFNRRSMRVKEHNLGELVTPSSQDIDRIIRLYAVDFEVFGYGLTSVSGLAAASAVTPTAPSQMATVQEACK